MNLFLLITATLLWDASEFATGYEVYQRSGTNWNFIGSTNGLSFTITNRVAYGVIATNATGRSEMSTAPGGPMNLRITNTLQSASSVDGPWTNVASFVFEADNEQQQFFRGQLSIR